MKEKFSFLADARALAEIRKHKWIESQKASREIGFASAALDWIKKYGESWKKVHLKGEKEYNFLSERRKFRRFRIFSEVKLNKDNSSLIAKAKDLSFMGLLCNANEYIPPNYEVAIDFNLHSRNKNKAFSLKCKGTVNRVSPVGSEEYEIFLRFDEGCQHYIEEGLAVFNLQS